MRGVFTILLAVILAYVNPILAREGGGGHQGGHHGKHGTSGGMASEHMSPQGIENSNAQWSTGATSGQDRSELRNQDHGAHGYGAGNGDHQGKGKHQGHHGHGHAGHGKDNKDKGGSEHKAHKGKGGKGGDSY